MQTSNQKHINFKIIHYNLRFRCRCSYQVNREKNFNYIAFIYDRMYRFQVSVRMFNTIKNHLKKRFMINIMCLKKIYEKREIIKIK